MNICIVGCTGLVGRQIISSINENLSGEHEFYLFATKKSRGLSFEILGKTWSVCELSVKNLEDKKIHLAFFAAGSEISEKYAFYLAKKGAVVIDNSSYFRMFEQIPLIVPEVNGDKIFINNGIIANPNCSTIQLSLCLAPLRKFGLKRVVVSTYQAVSGGGKGALEDLERGRLGLPPLKLEKPIHSNFLPKIGSIINDSYSEEELKIILESRKILEIPQLSITATAVRVPVENCHGESVNVEFERDFNLEEVKESFKRALGVKFFENDYPTALDANGRDEAFIGRLRRDFSVKYGVNFWVVADNLRKGAAQNAVMIGKILLEKGILNN